MGQEEAKLDQRVQVSSVYMVNGRWVVVYVLYNVLLDLESCENLLVD